MCRFSFLDQEIYEVEDRNIEQEQENDDRGVENGMTADEIVEHGVGRAVVTTQEHIVVIQ